MKVVPLGTFGNQVNPILAQAQAAPAPLSNIRTLAPQQGRFVNMGNSPAYTDAIFNQQIFRDDRLQQNALQAEALRQKNALALEGVRQNNALALSKNNFGQDKELTKMKFSHDQELANIRNDNMVSLEGLRNSNNIELQSLGKKFEIEQRQLREAFDIERARIREQFTRDENDRVYEREMASLEQREKEAQIRWENNLKKELEMRKAYRNEERDAGRETTRRDMQAFIPVYRQGLEDYDGWFRGNDKNQFEEERINAYMEIKHPGVDINALNADQANLLKVSVDRAVADRQAKIENMMSSMIRNPIPGFEDELTELQNSKKAKLDKIAEIDKQIIELSQPQP